MPDQCDPATRNVTMVLREIGRGPKPARTPVYQRAGFNLVSYDGDPVQFIEPVNMCNFVNFVVTNPTNAATPTTADRIVGFETMRARMFEPQSFFDNVDLS